MSGVMEDIAAAHARLEEARALLRAFPGVVGVGVGAAGASPVWRVYVDRDPAAVDLPAVLLGLPMVLVPATFAHAAGKKEKEIPVYKAGTWISSAMPATIYRWVTQTEQRSDGTLGCFARHKPTGKPVLLSCSHVIFPEFLALPSLAVYSPSYSISCCSGENIAAPAFDQKKRAVDDGAGNFVDGYRDGKWFGGFNSKTTRVRVGGHNVQGQASETDCAKAWLRPSVHFHNAWPDGTPLKRAVADGIGIGVGSNFGQPVPPEKYLRAHVPRLGKVIWATALTWKSGAEPVPGDVDKIVFPWGIGDPNDKNSGTMPNVNQLVLLPRRPPGSNNDVGISGFAAGDSGAIVINHLNEVVGMVCRAAPLTQVFDSDFIDATSELRAIASSWELFHPSTWFAPSGPLGIVSLISAVMERLDVDIPADENGWSGVVPAAGEAARLPDFPEDVQLAAERRGFDLLRGRLQETRAGTVFIAKLARHRSEIRHLLSTVRAISASWRDLQGAAFAHHVVESAVDPKHRIPDSINGVTRVRFLGTIMPLLARHASPELQRDLALHRAWLADVLVRVGTLDELPDLIARRRASS